MAATELLSGIILLPLCESVEDDIESAVIGGGGGNVRELLLLILFPLLGTVLPFVLSSPGLELGPEEPSKQASRRFFLSNLLKTFE